VNSFPRAKLKENCELQGTGYDQGQISEHMFQVKWKLLSLLSFKYFLQHTRSASLSQIGQSGQTLSIGFQNPHLFQHSIQDFRTDFASVKRICLTKKYNISVKGKQTFLMKGNLSKIQVADMVTV